MENTSRFRVDKKRFNTSVINCIETGIITEELGSMILIIVDNAIKSSSFGSKYNRSIREEAKGFAVEDIINALMDKKRPDDDNKMLAYYYNIASNFLRDFRSQRMGVNARKDIYGQNITVVTRPLGRLFGVKKVEFTQI